MPYFITSRCALSIFSNLKKREKIVRIKRLKNLSFMPGLSRLDIKKFAPAKNKHLYSKEHVLADDLSQQMREPKRFSAYLGLAQLYYESDLRSLARRVLEKDDLSVEARGKYFFASVKGLVKKPGAKLKNRKMKLRGHKAADISPFRRRRKHRRDAAKPAKASSSVF